MNSASQNEWSPNRVDQKEVSFPNFWFSDNGYITPVASLVYLRYAWNVLVLGVRRSLIWSLICDIIVPNLVRLGLMRHSKWVVDYLSKEQKKLYLRWLLRNRQHYHIRACAYIPLTKIYISCSETCLKRFLLKFKTVSFEILNLYPYRIMPSARPRNKVENVLLIGRARSVPFWAGKWRRNLKVYDIPLPISQRAGPSRSWGWVILIKESILFLLM